MTVHMSHPDLPDDQLIAVDEAAVPLHRAAGWVVVEAPAEPAPAPDETEAPSDLPARKRRRAVSEESD